MEQTVIRLSESLKARIKEVFQIKKEITAWNKSIILLVAQKGLLPAINSPTAMPENYQQHKNAFIARQKGQIQQGVES
ncbi:MAG: hypothetical protein LBD11_07160 [Candidatus Peribacteria bacterium]|jgi:hypothetical protein|nr:hypothetical protein [Candidatus Peribacteria bacterium]